MEESSGQRWQSRPGGKEAALGLQTQPLLGAPMPWTLMSGELLLPFTVKLDFLETLLSVIDAHFACSGNEWSCVSGT